MTGDYVIWGPTTMQSLDDAALDREIARLDGLLAEYQHSYDHCRQMPIYQSHCDDLRKAQAERERRAATRRAA